MVAVATTDGRVPAASWARTKDRVGSRETFEHVAVVAALLWWALPVTHGFGGRTPGPLGWGLLIALPALALTRPWSQYPRSSALATAVATAATAVCLVAPTGWAGADVAASYVYVALLALVVAAYARTNQHRTVLAVVVVLAGLEQCGHALQVWVGGGDPSIAMVGTFYWHNPFAAFLVAPALLGAALAATDARRWVRLVGFVGAPVAIACVVFSSSRATLAVLVVGFALLAVAAARAGRRVFLRLLLVGVLGVVVTVALPGPPLFAHRESPFAAAQNRAAAGETVGANAHYRTEFWREAVQVTRAHPLAGAGYHALGTASGYTSPTGWARSPYAHNGYLQAATDGGALLVVPFGLGCLLLGLAALAAVRRTRLRLSPDSALSLAAAVGALALLAHSAVDFDWSYPALLAMTGIVGALAAAGARREVRLRAGARRTALVAVALLAGIAVLSTVALRSWASTDRVAHNGAPAPKQSAAQLLARSSAAFGDARPAQAVLRQAEQGAALPPSLLREAWRRTAAAATVDPALAALRARALAVLGERGAAVGAVRKLQDTLGAQRSRVLAGNLAVTLVLSGQPEAARRLLGPVVAADFVNRAIPQLWPDLTAALRVGLLADPATERCAVATATGIAGPPGPETRFASLTAGPVPSDCSARLAGLAQ